MGARFVGRRGHGGRRGRVARGDEFGPASAGGSLWRGCRLRAVCRQASRTLVPGVHGDEGPVGDVQQAYAGRVRFAVFDFTTEATTARSRVDAVRLGLGAVFDDYAGETGTVLVLDGATKNVREAIHGVRAAADYRTAIDAALARTP